MQSDLFFFCVILELRQLGQMKGLKVESIDISLGTDQQNRGREDREPFHTDY